MFLPHFPISIHDLQTNNVNSFVSLQALHADEIIETPRRDVDSNKEQGVSSQFRIPGSRFLVPDFQF